MVNRSEVEQLRIGWRRALSATSDESEVRPIVELWSGDLPVQWLCCALLWWQRFDGYAEMEFADPRDGEAIRCYEIGR